MSRKRNWKRIKGYRKKSPAMPVLIAEPNVCQVFHNKRKFEFWTDLPLDQELTWHSVHGMMVDDRVRPPLPQGFNPMRPLRKPDRQTPHQAKVTAFAVLKDQRERARFLRDHPSLFPDLPIQVKPRGNVA
jgi:hypothetical protein